MPRCRKTPGRALRGALRYTDTGRAVPGAGSELCCMSCAGQRSWKGPSAERCYEGEQNPIPPPLLPSPCGKSRPARPCGEAVSRLKPLNKNRGLEARVWCGFIPSRARGSSGPAVGGPLPPGGALRQPVRARSRETGLHGASDPRRPGGTRCPFYYRKCPLPVPEVPGPSLFITTGSGAAPCRLGRTLPRIPSTLCGQAGTTAPSSSPGGGAWLRHASLRQVAVRRAVPCRAVRAGGAGGAGGAGRSGGSGPRRCWRRRARCWSRC